MLYSDNERLALAARMHTLLRRKAGRVTDTEWLAVNDDYAAEIVRFARIHATGPDMDDLASLADRLEIMLKPIPSQRKTKLLPSTTPRVSTFVPVIASTQGQRSQAYAKTRTDAVSLDADTDIANVETDANIERYVGGLR